MNRGCTALSVDLLIRRGDGGILSWGVMPRVVIRARTKTEIVGVDNDMYGTS